MFRSIRWRIAISFGALLLVVMLMLGVYLSNYVRDLHLENLESDMVSQVGVYSDVLAMQWEELEGDEIDQYALAWAQNTDSRVTIVAADGTVLGESDQDRERMENHLDRPEIQQALAEGLGSSRRFSTTLASELLYVAVPVSVDGQIVAYARSAYALRNIQATITALQSQVWLYILLATFLAILLAFWIAQRLAAPVIKMTAFANRKAEGQQVEYPYLNNRDEVGQLAQALDRMARQLQGRIEELRNEQVKLSVVLSQMTDGVVIVDPNGDISLLNPSAEQIFMVSEKKARGHSLVRALGYHQLYDLWENCRSAGREMNTTLELTHQHRFIQIVATPLGGELQDFTLLLCQDLTSIRRLETVRRDFISNISHELRTPLASLKALAETLQLSAIDDPETSRHFLERMETEIDALSQMVNELLELARIESGRVPLELKPVDACKLVLGSSERLRMQAERAGLVMEIDCQDQLPWIRADAARLEQVLVNIIHNAIKFTPPGGKITLFARQENGMVCFGVKDTGVGIPAEMLPRVFERFYKTDQARASGGTGLGLSISRHLVETHNGRIWAESQVGKGSTFFFTIPLARR